MDEFHPAQPQARVDDAQTHPRAWLPELHALRQRQLARVVDGVGGPAHVGLPRVGPGLAAAAGLLLAAEGTTDLRSRRPDVDVGDTAVGLVEEVLGLTQVGREDRRRKPLWYRVVEGYRLVEVVVGET